MNDACVLLGKPNVYGSIYRFEGQASVFNLDGGPNYRDLFPEPPPPGLVPNCAQAGVLGVLPGIIGTIQANEALKILLGIGEPLAGRLLLFDALKMEFREIRFRKNPRVMPIEKLIDYRRFCAGPHWEGGNDKKTGPGNLEPEISVQELRQRLDADEKPFLLDVREPFEWAICHIPGSTLVPLGQLSDPGKDLRCEKDRHIVTLCHSGARSLHARQFLLDAGFTVVQSLRGGVDAWARKVDPSMARY